MRFYCFAVGLAAASVVFASEPPLRVQGQRLEKPPTIDGVLGEGEWSGAAHINGFIDPVTERPPADNTEVWIGYDEQAIYLAFKCYDSDPTKLITRANQPNADLNGEDSIVFLIDPFNRRSYSGINRFQVSAKGTQNERLAGGRAAKREWRGEWQAKTSVNADHYVIEVRIPWQMMELPPAQERDMQINFWRVQGRSKVLSGWSNTTVRELAERDGIWQAVTSPKAAAQSKLSIMGYVAPEYEKGADPETDIRMGVDLRYRFTPQATGLLSVRPDFRNIEQQVESINFTRTEQFLDDSRPFFSEGANYFNLTADYSIGRMFYSRRIADFDVGAKFFGALDKHRSVSALVTRDAGERTDSVVRYRQQFGPQAFAAVYGTNTSVPGFTNTGLGASGYMRKGNWGGTVDYVTSDFDGLTDKAYSAAVNFIDDHHLAELRYTDVGEKFSPPISLVPYRDRVGGYAYYQNRKDIRTGPFRRQTFTFYTGDYEHHDGRNFDETTEVTTQLIFRNNYAIGAGTTSQLFETEKERTHYLFVAGNVDNPFKSYTLFYNWGERGGDPTKYLSLEWRNRFAGNFDISLDTSLLDFQGTTRQTVLGLGWEIDPSQSISARVVRRDDSTNWYMAYRKAGFKGLEWFVIVGDPNAEKFKERVVVKLVWAA